MPALPVEIRSSETIGAVPLPEDHCKSIEQLPVTIDREITLFPLEGAGIVQVDMVVGCPLRKLSSIIETVFRVGAEGSTAEVSLDLEPESIAEAVDTICLGCPNLSGT